MRALWRRDSATSRRRANRDLRPLRARTCRAVVGKAQSKAQSKDQSKSQKKTAKGASVTEPKQPIGLPWTAQISVRVVDASTGMGVFAEALFRQGDLVEACRALPFLIDQVSAAALHDHRLSWTEEEDCVGTGCAMLYNHSDDPNCVMVRAPGGGGMPDMLYVVALRDIVFGEQLLIRYKCEPWWVRGGAPVAAAEPSAADESEPPAGYSVVESFPGSGCWRWQKDDAIDVDRLYFCDRPEAVALCWAAKRTHDLIDTQRAAARWLEMRVWQETGSEKAEHRVEANEATEEPGGMP